LLPPLQRRAQKGTRHKHNESAPIPTKSHIHHFILSIPDASGSERVPGVGATVKGEVGSLVRKGGVVGEIVGESKDTVVGTIVV
jgi:hypothetical protein